MPSLTRNLDGSPHIHCYVRARRSDLRKDPTKFICDDPICTSYKYKYQLYGKISLCAVCRVNTITLNHLSLKLARPRCEECSQTNKAKAKRQMKQTLDQLLGETSDASS